jgi:hypothetical protein
MKKKKEINIAETSPNLAITIGRDLVEHAEERAQKEIEKLIKSHKAKNPDGWIARDERITGQADTTLFFHNTKPIRDDGFWGADVSTPIYSEYFNDLTWEDEPKPVYLSPHSPEEVEALVGAAASAQKKTQMTVEYHVSKDTSITKDQVCKCWLCQIAYSLKKALKPFKE